MILSIAWKNIWRNKLRSAVVIFALAVGLLAGISSVAIMNGAVRDRVDAAIRNEVASIQLHNPDFLGNGDVNDLIENSDSIINLFANDSQIAGISARLKVEAMVNSGHGPRGAVLYGIDPLKEKKVSQIPTKIADSLGGWFNKEIRNPIVISQKMAERLKVKLNSKIQVDAVSVNGDAIAAIYRVVGIYKTDNSMFDEIYMYVHRRDLQKMLGFDQTNAHEIAILTKDIMKTDSLEIQLKRKLTLFKIDSVALLTLTNLQLKPYVFNFLKYKSSNNVYSYDEFEAMLESAINEEDKELYYDLVLNACEYKINVMTWAKLSPEIELTTYWMDFLLFMFVGIILMALGFGIVNTMLMVVLERVKELGMLMAIGMNRLRVYYMVMVETVILTLVGGIVGIGLSSLMLNWLGQTGINLSSMAEGFNAMGYGTMIYPYIDLKSYIQVVVMVLITGVLSAVYPAWKAIKLNPADAIRTD